MQTPSFQQLRDRLKELRDAGGLTALKTGTEVEDMSFEEIRLLRALSDRIVPLFVKIGGPEARNDMRELARAGVDGLIAPMIESPVRPAELHRFPPGRPGPRHLRSP